MPGRVSTLTSSSARCRYAQLYLSSLVRPGSGPTRCRQECSKPPDSIESPENIPSHLSKCAENTYRIQYSHPRNSAPTLRRPTSCSAVPILAVQATQRTADSVREPRSVCGVRGSPVLLGSGLREVVKKIDYVWGRRVDAVHIAEKGAA